MNDTRSGGGPDDDETGTWTSETLPLHVRRALLERELKKLGLRKPGPASRDDAGEQEPRPQGDSSHPKAATHPD